MLWMFDFAVASLGRKRQKQDENDQQNMCSGVAAAVK